MKAARPRLPLAGAALLLLAACGEDALPTPAPTFAAASQPAPTATPCTPTPTATQDSFGESVSLTTTSDGLKYGDIVAGAGAVPKKGENVTVEYTGWLTNGTVFDSSRKPGRCPFSFVIGATPPNVIAGWEEGVITMHVGGKRRLVIPAALGYGAQAQGSIPANSTLIFDVELLAAGAPSPTP